MKGFRFIEVISQCPTAFGRRAGFKDAGEMLKWFKENAVSIEQAEKMSDQEASQKIVVGEYPRKMRPTFVETVYNTMKEAQEAED
jgi:2-oxoglutarate ferredoxin oxidoreductase subunit beta